MHVPDSLIVGAVNAFLISAWGLVRGAVDKRRKRKRVEARSRNSSTSDEFCNGVRIRGRLPRYEGVQDRLP